LKGWAAICTSSTIGIGTEALAEDHGIGSAAFKNAPTIRGSSGKKSALEKVFQFCERRIL
jgi:hypothetical protein